MDLPRRTDKKSLAYWKNVDKVAKLVNKCQKAEAQQIAEELFKLIETTKNLINKVSNLEAKITKLQRENQEDRDNFELELDKLNKEILRVTSKSIEVKTRKKSSFETYTPAEPSVKEHKQEVFTDRYYELPFERDSNTPSYDNPFPGSHYNGNIGCSWCGRKHCNCI